MNKIKGKQIESVDLDQVLMESDLVVTSAVGAITSADFDSGKTYKTISRFKADGVTPKTIQELLQEIFTKDNNPTVTNPSVSLSTKYTSKAGSTTLVDNANLTADVYREVGEQVVFNPTVTFNAGSYQFGPATGCSGTTSSKMLNKGAATNIAPSTGKILEDGDYLQVSANATYTAGATPKTQLGNNATALAIVAGTTPSVTSKKVTAYRKYFYGGSNTSEITSAVIRKLTGSTAPASTILRSAENDNSPSHIITVQDGDKCVIVAAPKDAVKTLRATQPDSLNAVIGSFSKKDGFSVEGANGAEAVAYDVWVWQPAELPAGMRVGIQFLNK
jgi:hypothetical protein